MDLSQFRALTEKKGGTPHERGAAPSPSVAQAPAMTVTALNDHIRRLFESSALLSDVCVQGEISNFVSHRSGHLYFALKDEGSLIRAVMFRSAAAHLRFLPETGMKVIARGYVSLYLRDGQYQLYVTSMEPQGIGSLYLAFEQCKRRLEAEGLLNPARKKPLPALPSVIGVITSPTGAAIRDILHVLKRRFPYASVLLYPSLVQGEGAAEQLAAGVRYFNEHRVADVLIIGRGGGSMEDLWAFNDEALARTVAASAIPVVSAVGHESDVTICDFVADRRAPTPSAAAELVVPDGQELSLRLHASARRLQALLLGTLEGKRKHWQGYAGRPLFRRPEKLLDEHRMRVLRSNEGLTHAAQGRVTAVQTAFRELAAKLHALSPLATLTRGYSAVFDQGGRPITSAGAVIPGEAFSIRFHDGMVEGRAERILPLPSNDPEDKNV